MCVSEEAVDWGDGSLRVQTAERRYNMLVPTGLSRVADISCRASQLLEGVDEQG